MTAKLSQLRKRREGQLLSLDEFEGADIAEVMRGQSREHQHPDVGRRGAVRDDGPGIFLEVVRRQPVVFSSHKSFEEAPGTASHQASERSRPLKSLRQRGGR